MRIPAIFRTSVFQLTILYVVLFGVSVVTLGWFIYYSTVGYLQDQTDEVIEAELNGLYAQFRQFGTNGLASIIRSPRQQPNGERFAYLLMHDRIGFLAGNIEDWERLRDITGWIEFRTPDTNDNGSTLIPVRAYVQQLGPDLRLLVGREIRELEQIKSTFRRASVLGLGMTMVLALGGGLMLAFSAQRHVTALSRTTRRIIAGDLSQRVPVEGHDEHAELATSVNTMLDQIEHLMVGLRHVGDSIAHDLRGPLTRLRTRLEALAAEDSPSRESVEDCLQQADGVLATFNALLRIARVESGAYRREFAIIDLGPIANDVADLYEATAEENLVEIRRHIDEESFVFGDRELIAQALTNLIDNAVKYTPVGAHIDLDVRRNGDRIVIVVADSGPGVPAEARERVLQRFARLDESRSKPGNGLGLALVRAVSDQHEGRLVLTDNAPGLRVTISLPAADPKSIPTPGTDPALPPVRAAAR